MISHTTEGFRKLLEHLPQEIQRQAKDAYSKFQEDPYHPSLHFKRVHSTRPIYSARISRDYRSIGILKENEIIWYWIGSHSEYDKLLKQQKHA
jgi:mRNA-degrading endonuclease RelE of RelBE toxin-antitoxin system